MENRKTKASETEVVNNFRLSSELKNRLQEIATQEQRTLAGQIRFVIQDWVKTRSMGAKVAGKR